MNLGSLAGGPDAEMALKITLGGADAARVWHAPPGLSAPLGLWLGRWGGRRSAASTRRRPTCFQGTARLSCAARRRALTLP